MRKRNLCVLIIIMLIVVVLVITGCGKTETSGTNSTGTSNIDSSEVENGKSTGNSKTDKDEQEESDSENDLNQDSKSNSEGEGQIIENEDDVQILNEKGTVVASKSKGDFDYIASEGDGYYSLYRIKQGGFDTENSAENAIMKSDGTFLKDYTECEINKDIETSSNYVCRLDGDNIFAKSHDYTDYTSINYSGVYSNKKNDSHEIQDVFIYVGNGMFISKIENEKENKYLYTFYSCENDSSFEINEKIDWAVNLSDPTEYKHKTLFSESTPYLALYSVEHYLTTVESHCVYIVSTSGVVGKIEDKHVRLGLYGDGCIPNMINSERLCVFDCNTGENHETNFNEIERAHKLRVPDGECLSIQFKNGQAEIVLTGDDGRDYLSIIDKDGNYIQEPTLKE